MKETTKGRPTAKASAIALSKAEAETVFQRMAGMLKHIVSVPKSKVDKREAAYQKTKHSKNKRTKRG